MTMDLRKKLVKFYLEEKDTRIFWYIDEMYEMIDDNLGDQMGITTTLKKLKQEYKDIDKEREELEKIWYDNFNDYNHYVPGVGECAMEGAMVKREQLEKIKKRRRKLKRKMCETSTGV